MKIGITYRLFLSILIAASLAVFCIFLIMQWNINRGFFEYLGQGKLERLSDELSQDFAGHGNWDFLRNNPESLITRLMADYPDDRKYKERFFTKPRHGLTSPSLLPHGPAESTLRMPFILLDSNRNLIAGNYAHIKEATFRPIVHEGKTVGYIGLISPKHFLTPPQVEFLKNQKIAMLMAALGMLIVVMILSLPLARRIVRPIEAMAAATHDLASGKYSVRVPVATSDELGQLARDFNSMALALEQNEKARRQWVADISHELRTPLSVLRGEIEALMEGIRKTSPEAIASLYAEALRLHRLVDDLYQLSLSDVGALTYRKEDVDLAEVLNDSIESYSVELLRKGITITKDISRRAKVIVFADDERLRQLFSNLLDNSLKYTDAGGNLVVRLSRNYDQVEVDFEDSAPGVPEEELDKLFDRLYRVEGSRNRDSGGAGLGLAICRSIVEAHSGIISAHPSSLGGLLIRVSLPIAGGRL